jgi:hypothetical protein
VSLHCIPRSVLCLPCPVHGLDGRKIEAQCTDSWILVRATDENLTSENWEYILDVCDRVSASSSGPQQAIASLIKRLAHRNANVQLYTLELANALSQNCGSALHRELASRAFTDALLRLAGDRTTHAQVKQKVLERMGAWTEEFGRNPELGIMEQAYMKLRTQQPGLMPPSKPVKREISSEDRRKEDEELQMALALSIKDKGVSSPQANGGAGTRDDSEPQGTTAATVSRVRALYDFTPSEAGELAFKKNDIIAVLESVYKDWWKGSLRGSTGIFPLNYVEKLQDPSKEELERDAQMEAEVFGEIKNVEKLLALLSVRGEGPGARRGEREDDEISELYNRTLSIRPKLIELIGLYSQKKGKLPCLNIVARVEPTTDNNSRGLHTIERKIHQSSSRLRGSSRSINVAAATPSAAATTTIPYPHSSVGASNVPWPSASSVTIWRSTAGAASELPAPCPNSTAKLSSTTVVSPAKSTTPTPSTRPSALLLACTLRDASTAAGFPG